ncbi:hypothetical protein FRC19_010371 [Serendipita sp. 401]|nr:hypothetical protein FRC19_010371 [Serendipita sp. 401]
MPPKFKRPTKPTIKDVTSPTNGDDDDDAFFSRNTKGWKGVTVESISSPTRDKQRPLSSDDEAPMTKKRKRFKEKDSDWTRTDAVIQFEDSDSSIVEVLDEEKKESISSKIKSKEKPKTTRPAKRRSITPPPSIAKQDLQYAFQVAKEALFGVGATNTKESNTAANDNEDIEEEEEDPETMAIIERARLSLHDSAYGGPSPAAAASPQSHEEPQNADSLKLTVVWKGKPQADLPGKWKFRFMLAAPFRSLNEVMQEKTKLKEQDIVLLYKSQRILLGTTPKSLKMRKDTSEVIEVYPKEEWIALEKASRVDMALESDDPVEVMDIGNQNPVSQQDDDGGGSDTIVLNIQSAKYPTAVAVRAKKTATASKILLHYLKKVAEDVDQYDTQGSGKVKKRIKLSFDGEELNPNDQVGKAGAEDDDIWDAIGL